MCNCKMSSQQDIEEPSFVQRMNISTCNRNSCLSLFSAGSIYSTLAVAIERYMSVCHPHHTPSSCSGGVAVTTLVLFSILFNVCRFLEVETTYEIRVRTEERERGETSERKYFKPCFRCFIDQFKALFFLNSILCGLCLTFLSNISPFLSILCSLRTRNAYGRERIDLVERGLGLSVTHPRNVKKFCLPIPKKAPWDDRAKKCITSTRRATASNAMNVPCIPYSSQVPIKFPPIPIPGRLTTAAKLVKSAKFCQLLLLLRAIHFQEEAESAPYKTALVLSLRKLVRVDLQ